MITTRKMAIELGMTHEGTFFGVPVWFKLNKLDDDEFNLTPKLWVYWIWIFICDKLYEIATWFMSGDSYLETPMSIKGEI